MRTPEDRAFVRWCRRADARALGQLFDRCAPQLLRLAWHLAREASEAEDLVQQTFLTLIEKRESLDWKRPAWPWLVGVLERKARHQARERARVHEAARLEPRLVEEPAAPLEREELSVELARAIDALEEPYRQPLLLRLQHGLSLAEVAHLLGRSPATVRVQLHRGRELLRAALPPSLAGSLLLALASDARGLEAVRTHVLQQATLAATKAAASTAASLSTSSSPSGAASGAASSAAAAPAPWLGVLLVNAKLLTVLSLCALGFVLWPRAARDTQPISVERPTRAPVMPAPVVVESTPVAPLPEMRVELASPTSARALRGRVFDAETKEPLAGVAVLLFAARRESLFDAARRYPELWKVQHDGQLCARSGGDWPRLELSSPAGRFGAEQVLLYDEVVEGSAPMVSVTTDDDGRFELPTEAGGLLVCEADGYARRTRAACELEQDWDLALRSLRSVHGRVALVNGESPGVPLELSLCGTREVSTTSAVASPEGQPRQPSLIQSSSIEAEGVWTTWTDSDGHFEAEVASSRLAVDVLTPGWKVDSLPLPLDQLGYELHIIVQPCPVLHVSDARTGSPIERVRLLGREQRDGYVRWSGEFFAPEGRLEIPGDAFTLSAWSREQGSAFTLWSPGYLEAHLNLADLMSPGVHELRLEPGAGATIEGHVRRGSLAAHGAVVALVGHSPLQWDQTEDCLVDAAVVDAFGGFRLNAAAGRYLLRVEHVGQRYFELVELPRTEPIELDLDALGSIELTLIDEAGEPRVEHYVALHADDGRSQSATTDSTGSIRFGALCPQTYRILSTFCGTARSFSPEVNESVALEVGETRRLRLVVQRPEGPMRVRVLGFEPGWRWRSDSHSFESLPEDGLVEIDRSSQPWGFEVQASDGRRWSTRLPRGQRDFEVEIPRLGAYYEGVVLGATGSTMEGWRLYAIDCDSSEGLPVPSLRLGRDGHFRMDGLAFHVHRLALFPPAEASEPYRRMVGELSFLPARAAGSSSSLTIDLSQRSASTELAGSVSRGPEFAPFAEAILTVLSYREGEDGRLEQGREIVRTDALGHFVLSAPSGCAREVRVYERWADDGLVQELHFAAGEDAQGLEIRVDS